MTLSSINPTSRRLSSAGETVSLSPKVAAAVDAFLRDGSKPDYMVKPKSLLTSDEKQQAKIFKRTIKNQAKAAAFCQKLTAETHKSKASVEMVGANPYVASGPSDKECCCILGAMVCCFPITLPLACMFAKNFKVWPNT